MARYQWDPALETGYGLIDDQHRELFALANSLCDAEAAGTADAALIADAVYRLTDYVVEHFAAEEGLMREFEYPGIGAHKIEHEQLTGHTILLTARYFNGESVAAREIAEFLGDWLKGHIRAEDLRAIAHVRARIDELRGGDTTEE